MGDYRLSSFLEKFKILISSLFKEKAKGKEDLKLKHLGPTQLQEDNPYFTQLDTALVHKEVRNIALTGPYSSGKTTILNSYLNHRPELKALKISLAFFELPANSQPKGNDDEPKGDRNLIEFSLLQQLFY